MKRSLVLVAFTVLAAGRLCMADEDVQRGRPCPPLWERETLTGGWLGAGEALAEKGIQVALSLTQIYQINLDGGLATHRRSGRWAGSYDLECEFDLEKLFSLAGARVYVSAEGSWPDGLDASSVGSVGGFEVNGDAAGDRPIDLTQLYYEQALAGGRLRIRLGKLDLTGGFECRGCLVAFDANAFANDEATQFLNAALVNNPTIPFPDYALGAVVYFEPAEGFYLSAGVADAQGDARETGFNTAFHDEDYFFSIYEAGIVRNFQGPSGPLPGAYRAGLWYDPQDKEKHDGGTRRDDAGLYLSFDQMLVRENEDEEDDQGLGVFFRFGLADGDVSEARRFWSFGGRYKGLIAARDEDVIGFGIARGRLVRDAGFARGHTTLGELYYSVAVSPWLSVSPSIQYVCNPGGADDANHALVIGVRAQMSF